MTTFHLDTRTPEHKVAAEQVVKELKETFGKENVKVHRGFKYWILVEVQSVVAYFNGACSLVKQNNLMISNFENGKTKNTYSISADLIDTIFIL